MAENYYNSGDIGTTGGSVIDKPKERKYVIVQSLWTKPLTDKKKFSYTMYICALSLAYAHRSGYKVHMHTDSRGYDLLKNYGYDKLEKTLDSIPASVPTDMFAAGKFYAMRAEGVLNKVHIDTDVFIKKPCLDRFYEDISIDAICQQEEPLEWSEHSDKIYHMHILGYPSATRPNWRGSMNTGVIGFNNPVLAAKYFSNYFDALKLYTKERLDEYKKKYKLGVLMFDFILEQKQLSYLSIGHNVYALLPTRNACFVADEIGYQHLQGDTKWDAAGMKRRKELLKDMDKRLFDIARIAASRAGVISRIKY